MTFKQIVHFHHIYNHQNITKAANEIHISQPALSASIKALEMFLGVNLLKRIKGRIVITEEGEFFYNKSLPFIRDYDKLVQDMADVADKGKYIKIGIPLHLSTLMIPLVFHEFHSNFSDVKIEIVEAGAFDLVQKVLDEEIQIAVVGVNRDFHEMLNMTNLFKSRVCFCVSRNHPYAKLKTISFEEAIKGEIVMFDSGFYLNKLVLDRCNVMGIKPNILFTTNQLSTIKNIVSNKIACAFMIDVSVDNREDIIAIPLEVNMYVDVGIVTKKRTHIYKNVQHLHDFIVARLSKKKTK